jgi:CRISPR-associated exonuclease Cas4
MEEEYLSLSGLQHFVYCRRQWALIHIEQQWKENLRTVEGELFHHRAHDEQVKERRGNILTLRGLSVFSRTLGISGKCDVVEFHTDSNGVSLYQEEGLWIPYPIEYKRGAPKTHQADELQLCAQAMCLEEMLCCAVPEGALFYGETRHRTTVCFTQELRQQVRTMIEEMHTLYRRGYTPKVKPTKGCNACSLKELCLPALTKGKTVSSYIRQVMEEE